MFEEAIVTLEDAGLPKVGGYHQSRIEREWPGISDHNTRVIASVNKWLAMGQSGAFIKVPVREIIAAVADVYKVGYQEIVGERRSKYLIHPRFHAYALAMELRPDLGLPTIARIFNRDHSTLIHGRNAWHTSYARLKTAHIAAVNAILFPDAEPMVG